MKTIYYKCSKCSQKLTSSGSAIGYVVTCPTCNTIVEVPPKSEYDPSTPDLPEKLPNSKKINGSEIFLYSTIAILSIIIIPTVHKIREISKERQQSINLASEKQKTSDPDVQYWIDRGYTLENARRNADDRRKSKAEHLAQQKNSIHDIARVAALASVNSNPNIIGNAFIECHDKSDIEASLLIIGYDINYYGNIARCRRICRYNLTRSDDLNGYAPNILSEDTEIVSVSGGY